MNDDTRAILNILSTEQSVTSLEIASIVHLSDKTVRSRLKLLADELPLHGAKLQARPGKGYRLIITDENKFQSWLEDGGEHLPTTYIGRVNFILAYLLNNTDYIKLDDLSQMLYVSRNTITADLKQVECILEMHHLKIERRPNYGIRIEGSEFNRRICIANCLYKNNMNYTVSPAQKKEGRIVSEITSMIAKKYRMKMSEDSFESVIVHVVIANERIRKNQLLNYSDDVRNEMIEIVGNKAIEAAEEMSEEIYKRLNVAYNNDEKYYLALHLCGKVSLEHQGKYGNNLVISSHIDELVLRMLSAVYDGISLDFRDNLELRMSLNQHMVPLDIRLRYGITMKNPILEQIKQEYAFPYTIAVCACSVLAEQYQKEIPEDEIGYIAVLFALAMNKKDKPVRKYNIIVVCASGRGTSQLFMVKYKQAFGEYINKIQECSVFDLEEFDFKGQAIDFVFSTIPLSMALPVPVYEVSLLLNENEINTYQKIFENGDDSFIYHYFNQRLFIPSIQAENKEDALKQICEFTREAVSVPDDFYESVMKREEMGQTDFGNLVAIPHAYRILGTNKFVTAAILDKPVWWGHHDVQVVFLISLTEDDPDIERFYQMITNYLSDIDLVMKTINARTFDSLTSQLKEAYRK